MNDELALQAPATTAQPLHPPADQTDRAWRELHRAACTPYRRAGRFAWHFARGKLGRDPAFRFLIERGELRCGARVVDIGCGQGLLASLLRAADRMEATGRWPAAWPAAPSAASYTGLELMPRDVARAEAAWCADTTPSRTTARFVCADMCAAALPACDTVVILDVLHYVDHAAQQRVLLQVRDALAPGGKLLLRIGDAAQARRFAVTRWVDRLVTRVRGHQAPPVWCRTRAEWVALVEGLGFSVQSLPMSRGTPFANVLLIAQKGVAA
ncbi:MAG TPA: class I SAM-dependent methyltransferase [Methylibium sp.]|uniref:SAM-dependent methyltransferase n=1 Tax=Methylibium sp. TaxID=2067992 RepID=UPI002DB802F2|nr:class I SAM-dependent methyltransferase [Methylibium sp.]HEU4458408.1 class I SAM-dependent methyltransferase [Methylibium sp.]